MTTVHLIGASGYGALEAIRLLRAHPEISLGALESGSHAGQAVADHAPLLRDFERNFDPPGSALEQLHAGDAVICAMGSGQAVRLVPELLARGARVVDLSDDLRLQAHAGEAIYGFPDRYRDQLRSARLVANPGCYPTATLLAALPLIPWREQIVQLVVDAKSGITGAGRTPKESSLFAEVEGDVRAYGLGGHRHEPEIRQELDAMGLGAPLVFTPQVVPLARGMLVSLYAFFKSAAPDEAELRASAEHTFRGSPFVRVLPPQRAPSLVGVARTNDCELHVSVKGKVVRVLSAIDNLGRGAAAQAVQNLNLMLGLPEEMGLDERLVRS